MTEKHIIDAYCRIRTMDNTIPDDVLDFIKDAALKQLPIPPHPVSEDYTTNDKFWVRLKSFVADVQTGCMMGEEEKQMILYNCEKKINP